MFKFQGVYTQTHIYVYIYIYIPNLYSGGCHVNQPAGLDQQKLIESIDEGLSFDIAPYVEPGGHVSGAVGRGWWVVGGAAERKKCHELPKWNFR